MRLFLLSLLALLGVSTMAMAQSTIEVTGSTYTYNFAEDVDISSLALSDGKNATLVSTASDTNDAIAYFTSTSVTTTAEEGDGVLELYGAKQEKSYGPYAGNVNSGDETTVLWTSGKTQGSGVVWYDYFKVNVPADFADQYITISVDYISGSNGSDRYLVVDKTLSDISSENVDAINSHLASSVSSGQAVEHKATTTYYGGTALTESDVFYLIASNNVGVYSITVTFSGEAPTGTSTTVAVAEPVKTEIPGYLTVAMGSNNLLEDEETTIVVTENTDGTTTVAVPGDLSIPVYGQISMTVTDLSVTFTADENGEFSDGVASFKLANSPMTVENIEGTFVTTGDDVTIFESTIAVYEDISIAVSFTTEAPEVQGTDPEVDETTETSYLLDLSDMWNLTPHITGEMKVTFTENYGSLPIWSGTAAEGDVVTIYVSSLEYGDGGAVNVGETTLAKGENEITLTEELSELYLSCTTGYESVTFYATYTANEGEPEVLTITPSAWAGYDVVALELPSITYTGQWGSNYLLDAETLSAVTFNPETDDALEFTIEVEDADNVITDFASYIQVELDGIGEDGSESGFAWANFDGTTCTFVLDENTAMTVDKIYIKALKDNDAEIENADGTTSGCYSTPFTVNYVSITSKPYTPAASVEPEPETGTTTAIASVASDVEVVEVARYNLMGQKISGAEKGINIIVYSDGSAKKVLVK